MRKKGTVLLLGFIVILGGWWVTRSGAPAQPAEGRLDVWATWGDDGEQLQALLDRFEQSSGIPVRVMSRIRSDELEAALASAEPPDVAILSSSDLVESYYEQGLVETLDRWIDANDIDLGDLYPASLEQCRSLDGAYVCLPWGCDVDALFWNKDLFTAAGLDPERPPQTLEELVEYAQKLTIRDGQGDLTQVGFIPDLPRSHADLYVRMFGDPPAADEASELTTTSQPVFDAQEWQRRFYDLYSADELERFVSSFTPYMASEHPTLAGRRLSCQQCHRSTPVQTKKTPDAGFRAGRVAMIIDGQWQLRQGVQPSAESTVDYGVAAVPPPASHPERAGTTVVQGPVLVVPVAAKDKDVAAELLAWMLSPQVLGEAASALGMLPPSRAAAEDARFEAVSHTELLLDLAAGPNAVPQVGTPVGGGLGEIGSVSSH